MQVVSAAPERFRSPSVVGTPMNRLTRDIELWLNALGLVAILTIPLLTLSLAANPWQVAALVAIVAGVLQVTLGWFIRKRREDARNEAIGDVREMLRDNVNNQLGAILLAAEVRGPTAEDLERLRVIRGSVDRVSELLESISEDSLQDWKTRYEKPYTATVGRKRETTPR